VLVPFGLGILLYVADDRRRSLNMGLMGISALSLIFQVVDHVMRLPERARRSRREYNLLEVAIAKFESGLADSTALLAVIEETAKLHAEEEMT